MKPGVMIYFDLLEAMESLSVTDKGMLFEAILRYGKYRVESKLSKRAQVLWPMIRMRLDSDELRYTNTVTRRKYAAYVRWAKRQNVQPLDFVTWQEEKGYAVLEEDCVDMDPVFLPD